MDLWHPFVIFPLIRASRKISATKKNNQYFIEGQLYGAKEPKFCIVQLKSVRREKSKEDSPLSIFNFDDVLICEKNEYKEIEKALRRVLFLIDILNVYFLEQWI